MTTRHALRRLGGTAVALLLGSAGILATAPGASAEPHPSRAFSSCAGVNAEYPGGVARTQAAADRVVRQGHLRPIVCPTAYAENRARLDRDRDGVVCERRR
jgi:hypothetical protein